MKRMGRNATRFCPSKKDGIRPWLRRALSRKGSMVQNLRAEILTTITATKAPNIRTSLKTKKEHHNLELNKRIAFIICLLYWHLHSSWAPAPGLAIQSHPHLSLRLHEYPWPISRSENISQHYLPRSQQHIELYLLDG